MKRYEDYKKDPEAAFLSEDELKRIPWTRYRIIVPTEEDKQELLSAFEHIHYSDIDTGFVTVNQLVHEYLGDRNIIVDKELFEKAEKS
jgi:hypothetical protein